MNPVDTQVNASVTVPRGASRSTSRYAQATAGAIGSPAPSMTPPIAVTPDAAVIAVMPTATRPRRAASRRAGSPAQVRPP